MAEIQTLEMKLSAALKEFVETKKSSSKVVSDLSPVIKTTSELPLVNLEYWERYIREEYDNALASYYSSKSKFWESNTPRITLLDLCSWDGYRREKALRAIGGKVPNRFFLALVLRRLNDWVPQVRQAAQDVLSKVLVNTESSYVADVICFTLSKCMRIAVLEAIDYLEQVSLTSDPIKYAVNCKHAIEKLKSEVDMIDPDGFGLGTLTTVIHTMEEFIEFCDHVDTQLTCLNDNASSL